MEPWELSVGQVQGAYRRSQLSPAELVDSVLGRIEAIDSTIGAFREVFAESARREAADQTDELVHGRLRGPLHGIPVAVKELFDVEGAIGCYGSRVFIDRVSPTDAEAVRRLRRAGAIIVGITRSHEFGWGITTQHAELGSTRNPWSLDRTPGGSSGGSAAALATGMVPLALGSDTGGSIRIPAAFCGVAGLKPTYGRVPKRGAVALAPSLDHPGPMARSVADLVDAYRAMAGYDEADTSTLDLPVAPPPDLDESMRGLRIGLLDTPQLTPLTRAYEQALDGVADVLQGAGAELVDVEVVGVEQIRPAFGDIQMAEAVHYHSKVLGTYPARASDYGPDVRRRLELASEVTISQYLDARETAAVMKRRFTAAFRDVDVILTPVSAGGPSTVDRPDEVSYGDRTLPFRDAVMDYTVPQDFTGLPAAAVPVGHDPEGLPMGVQLTAARLAEGVVLQAAAGLEAALSRPHAWPELGGPR